MASSLHLNITALWYTWLWIGFLVDIFFFWIWWWCIIGYDVPVRTGILSLLGHGRQATQFSAIYFVPRSPKFVKSSISALPSLYQLAQ